MKRILLNSLLAIGLLSAQIACAASDPEACPSPYQLVHGEVTKAGVSGLSHDCFSKECFEDIARNPLKGRFQSVLVKPLLNGQRSDKIILAFTPEEDRNELREKSGYFEIGKTYEFCAKPTDRQYSVDELTYEIDDLTTIKEVN